MSKATSPKTEIKNEVDIYIQTQLERATSEAETGDEAAIDRLTVLRKLADRVAATELEPQSDDDGQEVA
jgi:hypothetical protein